MSVEAKEDVEGIEGEVGGVSIIGNVNEMSSRGGEASGAAASGPTGSQAAGASAPGGWAARRGLGRPR